MLTYGMESATLTALFLAKLDGFHAQCIRKILNIKATYFTEVFDPSYATYNNNEVLTAAHITPLSNIILSRQLQLLGHILRCSTNDIERHICFTSAFNYRARGPTTKRGRRRKHWSEMTAQAAFHLLQSHHQGHDACVVCKLSFVFASICKC